jgi:multidrug resistance efflux pump
LEVIVAKAANIVKRLVIVLVLLGVGIAGLLYARKVNQPQEIVLSGTLEARTVNVGSLVGGRVTRVLIDEGQPVEAGQLLVQLETETIDRQLAEQAAAIEAARAELAKGLAGPRSEEIAKAAAVAENDEKERQRQAALHREGIVSRELLDAATTKAKTSAEDLRLLRKGTRPEDIQQLRAAVEQQQRRLDTLKKQRAETDVHSSVTGVVQSFGLRPGDLVTANQTVAEILESSQLWVRVFVPATELALVKVGQKVNVTVDTFPDRPFPGHVAAVNPQGEYTPRNVQTRAQRAEQVYGVKVLVDPNPELKAGMAADVDLGVKGNPQ